MQRKERQKLAALLEKQGGIVRPTKKGFIAKHPQSKKCVTWHGSPSSDSQRGDRNLRSDIIGAGFAWPFDGN